jgi:two-component system chemotaxis sensor kinase CheA
MTMSNYDYANDSMLEMYLFESTTLLDQLDDILLQSEKEENLSSDNVNEIFRIMHTIKGSSAMMEFNTISHVSHKLEDLFYVVRDNGIEEGYFQELFDLVLEVSDFLKEEVEKIRQGDRPSAENESLISAVSDLLERMTSGAPTAKSSTSAKKSGGASKGKSNPSGNKSTAASAEKESTAAATEKNTGLTSEEAGNKTKEAGNSNKADGNSSEKNRSSADENGTEGQNTYYLHVNFTADCQMENIRAFMLVNKLETVGKVLATIPEELNTNPDASSIISQNGFYCSLICDLPKEEISAMAKGTLSVYTVEFIDEIGRAHV